MAPAPCRRRQPTCVTASATKTANKNGASSHPLVLVASVNTTAVGTTKSANSLKSRRCVWLRTNKQIAAAIARVNNTSSGRSLAGVHQSSRTAPTITHNINPHSSDAAPITPHRKAARQACHGAPASMSSSNACSANRALHAINTESRQKTPVASTVAATSHGNVRRENLEQIKPTSSSIWRFWAWARISWQLESAARPSGRCSAQP